MPFSIIDGDDVGNKVESHLLSNNVSGFTEASKMITEFIDSLADTLSRVSTAKIVSAGGDSILVEIDQSAIGELIEVLDSRQRPGVSPSPQELDPRCGKVSLLYEWRSRPVSRRLCYIPANSAPRRARGLDEVGEFLRRLIRWSRSGDTQGGVHPHGRPAAGAAVQQRSTATAVTAPGRHRLSGTS